MKNTRRSRTLAALCAVGLAAALCACAPSVPDTLKIGMLVSQTGPYALRGQDLVNGAQLAVDEINASNYTLRGKPVKLELVSFDDKGDAETTQQGAEKLVADGVTAIIGPMLTPQAAKSIPVIAAAGIPQFFTATAAELTSLGRGNAFRMVANDDLQGKAMASVAIETLKAQRIAAIVESGSYGRGLNQAFVAAMPKAGPQVVVTMEVGPKDDVTGEMAAKIKAANVDTVVLFAREQQLVSMFSALQQIGYTDLKVLGSNVIRNANVAAKPVPVRALYAAATAIDAGEFPNGATFLKAFRNKFGTAPVWGAHYSYDAVYALSDALRHTDSLKSADILVTLKRFDPSTRVLQSMRFTESGEQKYPNIGVYKVERGKWELQFISASW